MAKTLCDWKKDDIARHPERLASLLIEPQYFCRKCARCSNTRKALCKPAPLPVPASFR
ncbi:hypothetical protein [Roseibacillus ishigakijimensis]|uniref:Uncharacterized protein n=1 Tax=Roseibacillus ishigakijimensis TaxID=454146 RepID=A0A934RPB0_9BACT|nr:hypothetical protein [Roseibacillus ishigakijimensis]MBK1833081.1 hypothetical protein [Roseibacillus ishigakijimensis]